MKLNTPDDLLSNDKTFLPILGNGVIKRFLKVFHSRCFCWLIMMITEKKNCRKNFLFEGNEMLFFVPQTSVFAGNEK